MINEGIRTYLIADTTLQSLLGASAAFKKVYAAKKPKEVPYPCIVITLLDEERPRSLVWTSGLDSVNGTYDFDCMAKTVKEAEDIRKQLRIRLFANANGGTWGDDTIDGVRVSDGAIDFQEARDASDSDVYIATLEAEISYREAVV